MRVMLEATACLALCGCDFLCETSVCKALSTNLANAYMFLYRDKLSFHDKLLYTISCTKNIF